MIVRIQGVSELQNQIYYDYDTEAIPLGQGGMGIVYPGRCFRVDNPEEYIPVAIKLMTNTNQDMIKRAMREASIQIEDPNLLRMYGFIPNMEPDPYTHEMKPKYYMVLHQAGYIHRDLDPSNIMITQSNEIKIIDYGVCKPVATNVADEKLTQTGAIIGKVDYAAPELLTGDIRHHNFTTDIYALGIMMFRLFVGSLPFTGDNTVVTKAHLTEPVPTGNISDPEIRRIVEKATRKAQEYRYQSVNEMLSDLKEAICTEKEPVKDEEIKVETHKAQDTRLPWILSATAGLAAGIATAFII